jgi:riboflavin transporter FmnP
MNKENLRKLTAMGMLSAISVVLVWLIHFPLFPAAAFLEYDPADIPIFIGAFSFGPVAGLLLTIVTSIVQGTTVSAGSGVYGIIMHIISTGSFCLASGLTYKKLHTKKGAAIALVVGTLTMTLVMIPANLFITPYFMGAPVSVIKGLLLPAIIPFNFTKAAVNSIITFFLYKRISKLWERK